MTVSQLSQGSDVNELQIIRELRFFTSHMWLCERLQPIGWWEMDYACLTRAGYVWEYEVKLSLSDFRADAKKSNWIGSKHQILASGGVHCLPKRFYFVAPQGIIPIEEIPAWAGFIEVQWVGDHYKRLALRQLKKAPDRPGVSKLSPRVKHAIWRRLANRYMEQL